MLVTADWTLSELENRNYPDQVQGGKKDEKYRKVQETYLMQRKN